MSWLYLALAVIFETLSTTCLKMSEGFSILLPSLGAIFGYVLCFLFLSFSLKTINISVAYSIWCAFGILLISVIGMTFFRESVSLLKIVSILLIVLGTVGLKLGG